MASVAELRLPECIESELMRVRYFPRQLLTADDLKADQDYIREKQRRHNRFCHGWGAVCGLAVVADPTGEIPWRIRIAQGYAIGPYGDEIYVAREVLLDLAICGPGASTDPCEPGLLRSPNSATGREIFIAIKYAECVARPVRAMPAGCACEEEACEYSRIRDSYQLECLTELPPSHQPEPGPSLCDIVAGRQLPICPPCPTDPWVILARVNIPAFPATDITDNMIDNFTFRRQVLSTAALQDQLIECCCGDNVAELADLAISKAVSGNGETAAGLQIVRFEIAVTNNGPTSAQNIVVIDQVVVTSPETLIDSVVSFEATHGAWTETNPSLPSTTASFVAEISELSSQETATLVLSIAMRGQQISGENRATVSSDTPDPVSHNNEVFVLFQFSNSN